MVVVLVVLMRSILYWEIANSNKGILTDFQWWQKLRCWYCWCYSTGLDIRRHLTRVFSRLITGSSATEKEIGHLEWFEDIWWRTDATGWYRTFLRHLVTQQQPHETFYMICTKQTWFIRRNRWLPICIKFIKWFKSVLCPNCGIAGDGFLFWVFQSTDLISELIWSNQRLGRNE